MVQKPALNEEELREKLLRMTFIYSYRRGSFTLTSGRKSNYYIDGKQITMAPDGLNAMAEFILVSLNKKGIAPDAVGGLTLGADPIAAAVCALSYDLFEYNPLSCFIVRKQPKSHGTRSKIDGPFRKGMQTIIVDDVLTTGRSILSSTAAVEEAGGTVKAVYVLVDRMEGGREEIAGAGYPLEAILNRIQLESLQNKMEEKYPYLFTGLQQREVDWGNIPWQEAAVYPALMEKLKERSLVLKKRQEEQLLEPLSSVEKAQEALKLIKIAELSPRGEKAALSLLKKMKE